MDFLDPRKKRAHRRRIVVGYVLMAVAIGIGTFILLLESFGYDLYNRSGEIIQNGLVFVENKPLPADISVNGEPEGRTGKRLVLPEGEYDISLEREGYRPWQRNFRLLGDSVEQLTYPLLVPEELTPEDVRDYDAVPQLVTQSPDRRWAVVSQPGSLTNFDLVDLNDSQNKTTTISWPEAIINSAPGEHNMSLVEWSTDNRHLLVKHSFPGGEEFLMLDREEPAQSFNVNRAFPVAISEVALRDKKFDRLHILGGDGTLWLGEVGSNSLTPIADRVQAFKSHGTDVLIYVTTDEDTPDGNVVVRVREGDSEYDIRELAAQRRYVLDVARYDGRWYMTVGAAQDEVAYVYRNPRGQVSDDDERRPAPIAVLRLDGALSGLAFSASARFIGAQSGSEFSVYDAEHDRQYRFDTGLSMSDGYQARWMDGFRYAVVSEGRVVMFEFDGSNQQALSGSYGRFLPMFRRDNQFLFTLTPSEGRATLTRTSLLAPQDQ